MPTTFFIGSIWLRIVRVHHWSRNFSAQPGLGTPRTAGSPLARDGCERSAGCTAASRFFHPKAVIPKNCIQSESDEVTIDVPASTLTLDRICTAGGFAFAGKRIEIRDATIEILDTDATAWVSSLDGEPITRSKRLLITHLTDLQNTGTRYGDPNRQLLLDWGQLLHLVRVGLTLQLEHAEMAKVYSLAVNGKQTGEVQASVAEGAVSVLLSVSANGKARMRYEIEVQPSASTD